MTPLFRSVGCLAGIGRLKLLLGLTITLLSGHTPASLAQETVPATSQMVLEVRKGQLIRLQRPAAAVFVADPEVADVQAHSPTMVYVFGRRSGTTTLFAVDENEDVLLRREVVVEHHLSGLQRVLREVIPDARLEVRSVEGGIIIEGAVRDAVQAQELREIAGRYLGENESLINRITVASPTQVNLRVRVAEVSREVTKLFGINWEGIFSPGDFLFGLATGRAFTTAGGFPFLRGTDSGGVTNSLSGTYNNGDVSINGIIDALEREGLVNVLAEPNLTALSGETASFLAGGEFPVPVGQDDNNSIQIQFKQFGVSLAFTPTVLNAGRISLRVRPEVSDLSDKGAIKLNDLVIPALSTRRAETTVELGSGQSFAIGGLISNSTRNNLDKVPGLGDLPVLGTLFRSTRFQRSESELVILVTPYLVAPVASALLATPRDGLEDPSDLERLIRGSIARSTPQPGNVSRLAADRRRLVGPAGFILD
ncbi:MAG: type II and III secretion system protein family protein [Geminicoccaceae bacterium]